MTSKHRFILWALVATLVGCGNYSNEDLEFMNALPSNDALRAEIPPRSAAISPADEAELAALTHKTTRDFNGLSSALLTMVDWIRSHPPTSRTPDSRTWGPYAADRNQLKNRDFKTRMFMRRDLVEPNQMNYEIAVHKDGTADTLWPVFIRGSFHATETARRGTGHIELVTADVRAAGLDVTDFDMLDHLEIDYDTIDDPVWLRMTITSLRDPLFTDEPPRLVYEYRSTFAGQGQMTFDLFANFVPGLAQEHLNVTSHWLPSGAGRAVLTVVAGDGAGSMQQECWDDAFRATFNDKPWAPDEAVPADPADPAICPVIPDL